MRATCRIVSAGWYYSVTRVPSRAHTLSVRRTAAIWCSRGHYIFRVGCAYAVLALAVRDAFGQAVLSLSDPEFDHCQNVSRQLDIRNCAALAARYTCAQGRSQSASNERPLRPTGAVVLPTALAQGAPAADIDALVASSMRETSAAAEECGPRRYADSCRCRAVNPIYRR